MRRDVLVGRQGEVAVDLIREDQHLVLLADISHAGELCPCPDTSARILRVTENQNLTALDVTFELLEVDDHFIVVIEM